MKHSPGPWSWGTADEYFAQGGQGLDLEQSPMYREDWLFDAQGEPTGIEAGDYQHQKRRKTPYRENFAMIAKAPEMLALLEELEWAGDGAISRCPECGAQPERSLNVPGEPVPGKPGMVFATGFTELVPGGHLLDCRLGALLEEMRKP